MEIKRILAKKDIDEKELVELFDLKLVFQNSISTIYENEKMRISFDQTLVRIVIFNGLSEGYLPQKIDDYMWKKHKENLEKQLKSQKKKCIFLIFLSMFLSSVVCIMRLVQCVLSQSFSLIGVIIFTLNLGIVIYWIIYLLREFKSK